MLPLPTSLHLVQLLLLAARQPAAAAGLAGRASASSCACPGLCAPLASAPPQHEVVVFATGYNGPIDNGDDWHYFDFARATTVVAMGGAVPSGLVCAAHAHGVRVAKGQVMDVDASNGTAVAAWAAAAAATAAANGADGVSVLAVRGQRRTEPAGTALVTALQALRRALPHGAQVSATVPWRETAAARAAAEQADFIVLAALDSCMNTTQPSPNVDLRELVDNLRHLEATGPPPQKAVLALPWYGWDFRCSSAPRGIAEGLPASCDSTPPLGTAATWHGWNLQRSIAFISAELRPRSAPPLLDNATATKQLAYTDSTGVPHVVMYDDEMTLSRKYAACAAAGLKGVGVYTADMVSYLGDVEAHAVAAAMWASLDGFLSRVGDQIEMLPAREPSSVGSSSAHRTTSHQLKAKVRRLQERLGLAADEFIPGYDPCKHKPAMTTTTAADDDDEVESEGKGCSDGLLCISPLPNKFALHESGGCYPANPQMEYIARTLVPPIPPTFRPEEATTYYYLNLVMPDDGNSDVTNSTKGYGFMNQFVPQLELGEALCGSTGAAGGYQTGACSIVDPLRQWVIQSQYFFGVLNHSGVPDPSGVSWTGHAVTGETIPVFPGETVVTNFTQLLNGTWLLQYSVDESTPGPGGPIAGRGNVMSMVQVDHPYMNPELDWLHPDFNHTLAGACNEVYNLQPRKGDVARPLEMNISIVDHAPSDDAEWMVDWQVNEGLPQCASGFGEVSLLTSYTRSTDVYSQTARLSAKHDDEAAAAADRADFSEAASGHGSLVAETDFTDDGIDKATQGGPFGTNLWMNDLQEGSACNTSANAQINPCWQDPSVRAQPGGANGSWYYPNVTSFNCSFTVPPTPAQYGPHSIFLWCGLQPGGGYGVIQPQIMFGPDCPEGFNNSHVGPYNGNSTCHDQAWCDGIEYEGDRSYSRSPYWYWSAQYVSPNLTATGKWICGTGPLFKATVGQRLETRMWYDHATDSFHSAMISPDTGESSYFNASCPDYDCKQSWKDLIFARWNATKQATEGGRNMVLFVAETYGLDEAEALAKLPNVSDWCEKRIF